MTSDEIKQTSIIEGSNDQERSFWLREIALQLSLLMEHFARVDEQVFGSPRKPPTRAQ